MTFSADAQASPPATRDTGVSAMSKLAASKCPNLVSWALSGNYDVDKPVLIDAANPHRNISKRKAVELVACLAGSFDKDSTVCLHIANDILYPILTLAIYASKCRWTGTNIAYTAVELEHHFRISRTKYVVTAAEHLDTVEAAIRTFSDKPEVIIFTDLLADHFMGPAKEELGTLSAVVSEEANKHPDTCKTLHPRCLHDLKREMDPESLFDAIRDIKVDSVAALMSTSGTTGLPKMSARTHRAIVWETQAIEDHNMVKPYEVRRLYCTPIFHGFSAPEMIINALRLGQKSFFMKRYDEVMYPQKIHEYQITETAAPPPLLLRLVQNVECHWKLQSLRAVLTGGAPLAPELRLKFLDLFQTPPRIVQVWGMTEGGWFTTFKYPEDDETSSVGRPVPGSHIKVCESEITMSANGFPAGELYFRSPSVMVGYLGDPSSTQNAFSDGWLKTGDVGYVQDGKVYLVDRVKDLIKVNGWQVAPAELENVLLQSPHVRDVAVVGVGQDHEEHPVAFVVPAHADATEQSITDHLNAHLSRYKTAHCRILFTDSIPKSVSGKILRKDLKKLAEQY